MDETLKAIDQVTARLNQIKMKSPPKRSKSRLKKEIEPSQQVTYKKISSSSSIQSLKKSATGGTKNANQESTPRSILQSEISSLYTKPITKKHVSFTE
jgi:hypothetical protein